MAYERPGTLSKGLPGFSLYRTIRLRQGRTWIHRWWPVTVFTLLTAGMVAAGMVSALSDPHAYFQTRRVGSERSGSGAKVSLRK